MGEFTEVAEGFYVGAASLPTEIDTGRIIGGRETGLTNVRYLEA